MNSDIMKGKWLQVRGDAKKMWGKLTDDDLAKVDGDRDRLIGMLQERYGYNREQAKMEVDRFDRDIETRYSRDPDIGRP